MFYKPAVEAYLQELEELEEINRNALVRWCHVKQRSLDEIMAVITMSPYKITSVMFRL